MDIKILSGDLLRGHSETIILSILKEKDSYGYELNTIMTNLSDGSFMLTEATMYTTLKRLETNDYVSSYWRDGTNTKRKYYKITKNGLDYLEIKKIEWENSKNIIDKLLRWKNEKKD